MRGVMNIERRMEYNVRNVAIVYSKWHSTVSAYLFKDKRRDDRYIVLLIISEDTYQMNNSRRCEPHGDKYRN